MLPCKLRRLRCSVGWPSPGAAEMPGLHVLHGSDALPYHQRFRALFVYMTPRNKKS